MMSIYIMKGKEREDKLKIVEKAKGREGDFLEDLRRKNQEWIIYVMVTNGKREKNRILRIAGTQVSSS